MDDPLLGPYGRFEDLDAEGQELYLEILGQIVAATLRRATPGELAIARARLLGVNVMKPGEVRN